MTSSHSGLRYDGDRYTVTLAPDRPFALLADRDGHRIADLFIPSSVHPMHGRDDTTSLEPWQVDTDDQETVFRLRTGSAVWHAKEYRLRCSRNRLSLETSVEGHGEIAEALFFGGNLSALPRWGSGFFASGHSFAEGFNPEPNTRNDPRFDPAGGTVIDLTGGPLPGKRHWFFNPPPFCLAFRAVSGWLGAGVEGTPATNGFSEYRYHALQAGMGRGDAFWLSLAYDGGLRVDGRADLPTIGFDFGDDPYAVLAAHVAAVRSAGKAPVPVGGRPAWWREPIFCGWGAQCALAAAEAGYPPQPPDHPDVRRFLSAMPRAGSYARQGIYDGFMATLDAAGLRPGTVVIDDKWQATYGENQVDPARWPDLRGFIDGRHERGQRVLLWLKAWDREGVPDDECIRNAAGVVLGVDPTNPSYERRLRESIRRMLSPDGYDADGFKIDFTHRIPIGPGLRMHGPERGLALLRRLLEVVRDEAKRIKADALIMTHTPNPYLADLVDVIRLNDMLDLTELDDPTIGWDIETALHVRMRVARIGCPEALIDTDNWPVRNREVWRRYAAAQPGIGVPSLYFTDTIDLTQEPLTEQDHILIRETWNAWREQQ